MRPQLNASTFGGQRTDMELVRRVDTAFGALESAIQLGHE